ncbi:39S ribosomal protein L34, mitochondrial [Cimex lectularius]|uniref:Large ribosomal subunit protein bL34m n=1 Tax=Cimex lectularius TaxID=79782 RepID=A0A8I6RXL1_CIMLE|nr:39S ribosomal protein L34, mitochondrial [Cimex lectularius]
MISGYLGALLNQKCLQQGVQRCAATFVRKSTNDVMKYEWKKHFRIANTRCYFPRAHEGRRLKVHGWDVRMSTEAGRKVLMSRILKGRHVLSH